MRVLFVGGGTLGSVTPLLAVAEELNKKIPGIFFWGTRRGPERAIVETAGIPFRSIPAGKIRRYWDIRNIFDFAVVKWAFWIAFARLVRWRPSVVVGAGSFVQVPVMWAAWILRIPIVIHQLDVRSSLANRLVAPLATRITVTFPSSVSAFRRAEVVGAPVRRVIFAARDINPREAKRRFGFDGDRPVLLVIGGGAGAQAINELVRGALPELTSVADVIHVTGRGKIIGHCEERSDEAIPSVTERDRHGPMAIGPRDDNVVGRYHPFEVLTDDLPLAYAAADLVVSRAGIGAISELVALGKPTALIPMPATHQEDNAAVLAAAGAAVVWDQRELTPTEFTRRLLALLHDGDRRKSLAVAMGVQLPTDAARRIASYIIQIQHVTT